MCERLEPSSRGVFKSAQIQENRLIRFTLENGCKFLAGPGSLAASPKPLPVVFLFKHLGVNLLQIQSGVEIIWSLASILCTFLFLYYMRRRILRKLFRLSADCLSADEHAPRAERKVMSRTDA